MRSMPRGKARDEVMDQLDKIIKDDVPMIPLLHPMAIDILQKNIRNYRVNLMVPFPYKYVKIDEAAKTKD